MYRAEVLVSLWSTDTKTKAVEHLMRLDTGTDLTVVVADIAAQALTTRVGKTTIHSVHGTVDAGLYNGNFRLEGVPGARVWSLTMAASLEDPEMLIWQYFRRISRWANRRFRKKERSDGEIGALSIEDLLKEFNISFIKEDGIPTMVLTRRNVG